MGAPRPLRSHGKAAGILEIEQVKPAVPQSATKPGATANVAELLEERFHLRTHRVIKEGPVYLLEKDGKKPLKLREPSDKEAYPWAGSNAGGMISGDGIAGTNITMPLLAWRLTSWLGRPVIDATGLEGSFDFKFETPVDDDTHPDIQAAAFTAVQAIGLRLKSGKGPVETLLIDHAEKPSGN